MRFKDALYYGIAGLLFLASVPIYHYILTRERDSSPTSLSPSARVPVQTQPPPSPPTGGKAFYAWDEKLPFGYKCSAANGLVYRTRVEGGATVIEPLTREGVLVRCGGDERSSYRRN